MTEISTAYTFSAVISGKLVEKTLTVPFTLEEVRKLEAARAVVQSWGENAMDGPSIYRYLFTNLSIPWADTLSNRSYAILNIHAVLHAIEAIVTTSPKPDGFSRISDDLTSIRSNLLGFFELE